MLVALFACQHNPYQARQAAQDALKNACIQLDSSNKVDAMRLFKEAKQYGLLADNTLTVAHARYHIAQCLGYSADKEEVVSLLKIAAEDFGSDYADRAKA